MAAIPKIQGYQYKKIRCFERIFQEWIWVINKRADDWKEIGDIPWWYTERATLSTFAGAVWRAGGLCFEEYSDEKRTIGKRTHRFGAPYSGRVDLYFSWAGYEFIAEAKDTWSGCSRIHADPIPRLAGCLRLACKDVRLTQPNGQRRLGLAFVMPYIGRKYREQIDDKLDSWVEVLGELDTSAYAWVFPQRARYIHDSDGDFCPGVAVLIKEVRRGPRPG